MNALELAEQVDEWDDGSDYGLHREVATMLRQQQAEIEELKSGISYIQGKAESQRIWDGNKWHWNLPYPIKSIFDKCGELLK